jgi:16S rRNA (guanine(966)-N(2))-methyltransferase RsmD
MLKIQSGALRGRALETIPSPLVRPILARIKKSLFDIIRPRITGANFLDLYAGTGAVGIEALSQGAAKATFVEREARCVTVIHANLEKLKIKDRATVVRGDATTSLGRFMGSFDLVFMGPPYKDADKNAQSGVEPVFQTRRAPEC